MRSIFLILLLISAGNSALFKSSTFKKVVKNTPTGKLQKQLYNFSDSKYLKKITGDIKLTKITPLDKTTQIAKGIADKSPFANKMMGSKDPLYVMQLYSKGGDKFFKSSEIITSKALKIDSRFLASAGKEIPSLPAIQKLSQEQMLNKYVSVMKATGSFGLKTTKGLAKIAKDNPKSAVAGLMFAWFLADPLSFKEQMDQFGGNVEEFSQEIGSLLANVAVGGAFGFTDGALSSAGKFMTPRNIIILIGLFLLWLFWQFKSLIISSIKSKLYKSNARVNSRKQSTSKKRKGRF